MATCQQVQKFLFAAESQRLGELLGHLISWQIAWTSYLQSITSQLLTCSNSPSLLSHRAHIKALQSITPFFFCSQPSPSTRFFFNHCFLLLLPPLLCRTSSPGSMDCLTWCFRCWSYCFITWQSFYCAHAESANPAATPLLFSTALPRADVSSLPALPALLKTSLLSPRPNNLAQPPGLKEEPRCSFPAQQLPLLPQYEKTQLTYGTHCYYNSLSLTKQALPIL